MTDLKGKRSFHFPVWERSRLTRVLALSLALIVGEGLFAEPAPVVLVLGDSLSSGFGVRVGQGWVSLLEQRLQKLGMPHRVVNASISGDTTRGGVSRLRLALTAHRPCIVVVELGGNDGLRGLPLDESRRNLKSILHAIEEFGAQTLLAGMRLPPNYGPRYTESFHAMYRELAHEFEIPLIPFLLEGVAEDPGLMQADGIHPNARAQAQILENVWSYLEPMLGVKKDTVRESNRSCKRIGPTELHDS